MIVVVTIGCPAGLRGDITRWLSEIAAGVYVGNVTARVRDELWERICGFAGRGQALMIRPERNEQGCEVRTHNYEWEARDFDGLVFLMRPEDTEAPRAKRPWSKARGRRAPFRRQ